MRRTNPRRVGGSPPTIGLPACSMSGGQQAAHPTKRTQSAFLALRRATAPTTPSPASSMV